MKINNIITKTIQYCTANKSSLYKKVYRVAINAFMILNNCLITGMFFIHTNIINGVLLAINIVSCAIFIECMYKK